MLCLAVGWSAWQSREQQKQLEVQRLKLDDRERWMREFLDANPNLSRPNPFEPDSESGDVLMLPSLPK